MIIITKRKMSTEAGHKHSHIVDGEADSDWQNATWKNIPFILRRNIKMSLNMHVNL